MIKNYLLIALRTIKKNKLFSLINIVGLALSMVIGLMVILFIADQKNVDQFHQKKERIIRIYTKDAESSSAGWATTPGSLKSQLLINNPQIESIVRLSKAGDNILNTGTAISINGFFAEKEFLDLFSFSLLKGNPETVLDLPFSIVISENLSDRLFPGDNPLGKILHLESMGDLIVTGVVGGTTDKSHLIFDFLISFSTIPALTQIDIFQSDYYNSEKWTSFRSYYTYLLLDNSKNLDRMKRFLKQAQAQIFPPEIQTRFEFGIQKLTDINFGLNLINPMPGTKHTQDLALIPLIAIIVILLACFNYILLSIARSLRRSKEIGLRKVLGSQRKQILLLFLSEAFLITLISLLVATILLYIFVPLFNSMDAVISADQEINLALMNQIEIYILFFVFLCFVTLIAGFYPALYLSSFKPVQVLKGGLVTTSKRNRFRYRKILMVSQFVTSIVAIIMTFFLFQQHQFMTYFDKGIDTNNTVYLRIRNESHQAIRNELERSSLVSAVSFCSHIPTFHTWGSVQLQSNQQSEAININQFAVDPDFIENYKLQLLAGRHFSDQLITDQSESIILNQRAAEILGYTSADQAVGEILELKNVFSKESQRKVKVIGVVENFNYRSVIHTIGPLVLQYLPQAYQYAIIHYSRDDREAVKANLTQMAEQFHGLQPLQYNFYEDMESAENRIMSSFVSIAVWCSGFIILIALMGLLGMAMYTTEIRIREVGIRRVLGATVTKIVYQLGQDYFRLVVIASMIAIPLAWISSNYVIQSFAFRIELQWWVFMIVIVFVLSLALLTIGSQTIRAALANPVETLREE